VYKLGWVALLMLDRTAGTSGVFRVVMETPSRHQTDGTHTDKVQCFFVDSADPL
jgi:hypothetical protein